MAKKKTQLEIAQETAQATMGSLNSKIETLGASSELLYEALKKIQTAFEMIREVPLDVVQKYQEIKKATLNWKQQVEQVKRDYIETIKKEKTGAVAGTGLGVSVATMGPTAAMGIATTFGVASTGTAISSLGGAAATNAALAWLGGGTLAAGGGGMAAGNALLALAGPVGWSIAGATLVITGILYFVNKSKNNRLEKIYTLISERDTKSFQLAETEIDERIMRMGPETKALDDATKRIITFGTDYSKLTKQQKLELGAYVNLMFASNQLLISPILGLMPKYTDMDLDEFISSHRFFSSIADYFSTQGSGKIELDSNGLFNDASGEIVFDYNGLFQANNTKRLLIALANLLWRIELDNNDMKVFANSLKKNAEFVDSAGVSKSIIDESLIETIRQILFYKYMTSR